MKKKLFHNNFNPFVKYTELTKLGIYDFIIGDVLIHDKWLSG
jgi:hypothetical protein